LGTADAVLAVESFAAGGEFVVLNSDNLYPVECLRALRQLDGPGLPVFRADSLVRGGNIPAERLLDFAVLSIAADGHLTDIVEKPQRPRSEPLPPATLISMNLWRFGPEIFPFCRAVAPSPRQERELPHAVRDAVAAGMRLRTFVCSGGVLDLSRRADIAAVAERLANIACNP
ncbi:MAG TPA: sugar phosphate nucleotidyltransferase, partial [Rudaea sp.]|nr:sugar phosphate nucleotidyltransferase [Rudaea sp.]